MPTSDLDRTPHRVVRRGRSRRILAHRPVPETAARPRSSPSDRFRHLDSYRVDREWHRYEGTPQRDLFREIRARFLERHAPREGWSIDVGSGPGRFSSSLGGRSDRRLLMDLSNEMLVRARSTWPPGAPPPGLLRADGRFLPVREGRFSQVVAFGNPLGFAGAEADLFLRSLQSLVSPEGVLLLEVVAGPGERSRYLRRLPAGAVRRLLAAPLSLVRSRAEREGFDRLPPSRKTTSEFRRHDPAALVVELERAGFRVDEVLAVAPCLGSLPDRVAAVHGDPRAWSRLLELEEQIGRSPARRTSASAVLVSATRAPDSTEGPARAPNQSD